MENYIRRYDNVISPDPCDKLIDKFEKNPDHYEKQNKGNVFYSNSFTKTSRMV